MLILCIPIMIVLRRESISPVEIVSISIVQLHTVDIHHMMEIHN